jgi:hypothetical protein
MSHWTYKGKPFQPTEEEILKSGWAGFVYMITLPNGKKYIGRKYFFSNRTLPPLKGRKRKRHVKKESNWRIYTSSSNDVVELIQECNGEGVTYEILSLHHNKQEVNYHEMKAQFMLGVLEIRDENDEYVYLNRNINTKFYRSEKYKNHRVLMTEEYQKL